MDISEDKLINNALMFIYIRQNKTAEEKISNIENILNEGADINYPDSNNKNNTILHIAVQKEEKDVVQFLLKKGARLLYNSDNKTPMHIAKEKNTVSSIKIFNILNECQNFLPPLDDSASRKHQITSNQNHSTPQNNSTDNKGNEIHYLKRAGTSGVSGQFYESKLLSLVQLKALHDADIDECYLATNIRDIGDFDDVCFRFKMKEHDETKHVICFMQAKHKEDPDKARLTVAGVRSTSGNFSLVKYYDSFLKIKQKFLSKTKGDPMFEGDFNDINCYFIIYTPLKESFDRKLTGNKPLCPKLHKFIHTGDKDEKKEEVFQFNYEVSDVNCLVEFIQHERVKTLGKVFLSSILSNKTNDIMTNDLIQIYHPALAQKVIKLFSSDPNHFNGRFRDEFFDTDDNILITLKEVLYKEIVFIRNKKKTVLSKKEVKDKVKEIANYPSAKTISMLIGEVIFFDEKSYKLCLNIDKISRKEYEQEDIREINHYLQKSQVTQALVNEAIEIIGKEKLKVLTFKLPLTFGNTDFPSFIKDKTLLIDRLNFLTKKIYELIKTKKEEHLGKVIKYPIVIDISSHNVGPKKILEFNHLNTKGIGGLVGNLLQFEEENQTFAFNTNDESLGENSRYVLKELQKFMKDDLANYRFKVTMNNFPRTSFNVNQNDKSLAKEFFSKLWFYTNQAKEETVESILKTELKRYQNQFLFRVHSDAIFLRFHDEIQKWWKSQSQARYLTKNDTIFKEAKKDIIDSPVLTVLNIMFIRTLKKFNIEFDIDVINAIYLDDLLKNKKILNIFTDAVILSAAKILQLVKSQNKYTFISLAYLQTLPENEYSKIMDELKKIKAEDLVIICETAIDEQLQDTLRKIIKIFNEKIIIITEKPLQNEFYQNNDYVVFKDEKVNINNLNYESQMKILNELKVNYQGKEIKLNAIIDENSKSLIHGKLLWSILNQSKIDIGHGLNSFKYDEIKKYYVNQSLFRNGDEYEVNTFNDIDANTVLITSKPCVGKSILLTHLSLQTKKIDPQPWIVRINMSAHSNDFADWPESNIKITNIMRFLCKAALKKTDNINNLDFIEITPETVDVNINNGSVEDVSYELQWFIHFYNCGKVIFLFDGFDRICPHHTKEGMELFKALKQANKRMWITSNCYNINILEKEFGTPYKLEKLTITQQKSILHTFWKTNLKLEKLNHQQFENIRLFFDFIMKSFNKNKTTSFSEERPMIPLLSIPIHMVYLTAVEYFKNEINNLSPRFLRETIKKKWRLDSYTAVDRYLRKPVEEESLELSGTPLHMYIAANYFELQIKDKFDLHINKDVIRNQTNIYLNTVMSYERFLKCNLRDVCKLENKNIEKEQDKLRDDFLETHKILGLYAICKESDISKILTEPEIREAKSIIKRVASGEIKTHLIDCVVDDIPRFYNIIFAEYFIIEFLADFLKQAVQGHIRHIQVESLCNFLVNVIITLCPPGVRNAFEYKLKYDPELAEVASNENYERVIFDLILKQNEKSKVSGDSAESSLNIAINEGLVNVTNVLLKGARRHVDKDNLDGFVSVVRSGAFLLGVADPSWRELTNTVLHTTKGIDGEKLMDIVNSNQMEGVSRVVASVCANTEFGQNLHDKIKSDVCEPIKQLTEKLVTVSSNNENLSSLVELLPHHLPSIVNSIFGKK